jgi:DNA-directed RNA polymerase subunit K
LIWPKDRLTRFEVARIVGARALQVALGAPILVEVKDNKFDPIEIAEKEFKENKIPMTIKRTLPNNQIIIVDIKSAINNWLEEHQKNS